MCASCVCLHELTHPFVDTWPLAPSRLDQSSPWEPVLHWPFKEHAHFADMCTHWGSSVLEWRCASEGLTQVAAWAFCVGSSLPRGLSCGARLSPESIYQSFHLSLSPRRSAGCADPSLTSPPPHL